MGVVNSVCSEALGMRHENGSFGLAFGKVVVMSSRDSDTSRASHRNYVVFDRVVDCQPLYGGAWQGHWCVGGASPRLRTTVLFDELFHAHDDMPRS